MPSPPRPTAAKYIREAVPTTSDLYKLAEDILEILGRLEAVEASVEAAQTQPLAVGDVPSEGGVDRYAIVLSRLARLEAVETSSRLAKLECAESAADVAGRLAALESSIDELRAQRRAGNAPGDAGSSQSRENGDARLQEARLQADASLRDGEPRISTDGLPPAAPRQKVKRDVREIDVPLPEEADEEVLEHPDHESEPGDKFDVWSVPDAYVFQDSVWDASILLFCRNSNGESIMFKWDEVMLIFAFILNMIFQGTFLAIVLYDLLPNRDFDGRQSVSEFLRWRAEFGHQLDESSGMSMVELLCVKSEVTWSFLKEQVLTWQVYTGQYDASIGERYLIPGNILSLMSLFLWTMTCIIEYRSVVEQAVGLWMVPLPEKGSPWSLQFGRAYFVQEDDAITGELISMAYPAKIAVYMVMTVPRLLMLLLLMLYGMQFLAQTASLVDLVLNAIALAFVLDVDDFLSSILLTKHVRDCCTEMKPLVCGPRNKMGGFCAGCTKKFLLKCCVWITLFLIGIFHFLIPYYHIAQSTLDALCEGNLEFIVRRANETSPAAIVVDMENAKRRDYEPGESQSKYYLTCEGDMRNEYFLTTYPSRDTVLTAHESEYVDEVQDRMSALTLAYAFLEESIKEPPLKTKLDAEIDDVQFGSWGPHQEDYRVRNPGGWSAADIKECPRFQHHYNTGWRACTPMPDMGSVLNCTWTRAADLCDGAPPGDVYRDACDLSSKQAKRQSCGVYASFHTPHPYLNCDKVVNGTDVEMDGSLTIEVEDPRYFADVLRSNVTVLQIFTDVFETTVAALPDAVAAPYAARLLLRGKIHFAVDAISLNYGRQGRRLQAGATTIEHITTTTEDITTTTEEITTTNDDIIASTTTIFARPGDMVLPFSILQAPDTLTMDYINQADWRLFAKNLSTAMEALDPRLIVTGYRSHTSDVSHAYCSSYIWCSDNHLFLKPNASDIPGASEEVCCYVSCTTLTVVAPGSIEAACREIEDPPSEVLRSDAALTATAVEDDLSVCCQEQLTCDLIEGNRCEMTLHYTASLVTDPGSHHQGVQTGDPNDQLYACCSISCSNLQNNPGCDELQGLTLVPDSTTKQPPIGAVTWDKTGLGGYHVDEPMYVEACCEPTTVTCEEWERATDGCTYNAGLLVEDASNKYGEHYSLCCVDSCSRAMRRRRLECPSGYVADTKHEAMTPYNGVLSECCAVVQGSTCGEYRVQTSCDYYYAQGMPPLNDDTPVVNQNEWRDECCFPSCYAALEPKGDLVCVEPSVPVSNPVRVYVQGSPADDCCTTPVADGKDGRDDGY